MDTEDGRRQAVWFCRPTEEVDDDQSAEGISKGRRRSSMAWMFAVLCVVASGGLLLASLVVWHGANREATSRIAALEASAASLADKTKAAEARLAQLEERLAKKVTNEDLEERIDTAAKELQDSRVELSAQVNETVTMCRASAEAGVVYASEAARKTIEAESVHVVEAVNASATRARLAIEAAADAARRSAESTAARVAHVMDNETARVHEEATRDVSWLNATEARLEASMLAKAEASALLVSDTADQLQASIEQADRSTNADMERLNRTAAQAISRLAKDAEDYATALRNDASSVRKEALAVEKRLKDSTFQLENLESAIASYEASTDSRFATQSAVLRAWIAGFFAISAAVITVRHVYSHTTRMAFPEAQRKVLAILWMVPIYATTSWAAIVWPVAQDELQLASSCYEAYAVYMFFALLVAVLSDGRGEEAAIEQLPPQLKPPLTPCAGQRALISADAFMLRCKLATLQFVVVKPVLSVLEYIFLHFAKFRGELLDYTKPTLWITLLLNASVSLALAALFAFFHATQHTPRVNLHNPWPKFLAVKCVVFVTWFQSVAISLALTLKLGPLADERLALQCQSFLICIEMFVASAAHGHIFGADEWQPDFKPRLITASISDNLALHDFVRDFRSVLRSTKRHQSNPSAIQSPSPESERPCEANADTRLEDDEDDMSPLDPGRIDSEDALYRRLFSGRVYPAGVGLAAFHDGQPGVDDNLDARLAATSAVDETSPLPSFEVANFARFPPSGDLLHQAVDEPA